MSRTRRGRRGGVGLGRARHGRLGWHGRQAGIGRRVRAWHGLARKAGEVGQGLARLGSAWQAWSVRARRGVAWQARPGGDGVDGQGVDGRQGYWKKGDPMQRLILALLIVVLLLTGGLAVKAQMPILGGEYYLPLLRKPAPQFPPCECEPNEPTCVC
jgi:hypothetical protein